MTLVKRKEQFVTQRADTVFILKIVTSDDEILSIPYRQDRPLLLIKALIIPEQTPENVIA